MSNIKLKVNEIEIVLLKKNEEEYISLTDMARFRDSERTNYIIQNWMRTRSTVEFLGLWEQLHNMNFKRIEFDAFKNVALFNCTAKDWREANPELAKKSMNIRDIASINELAILSNLETLNAEMIKEKIDKHERYMKLREIAKYQLFILDEKDFMKALKKLDERVYIDETKRLK